MSLLGGYHERAGTAGLKEAPTVNTVGAELTAPEVEAHGRTLAKPHACERSPLTARAVRKESMLRKALGIAQHQAEAGEVVGGHVVIEFPHAIDSRSHGIALELGTCLEGQDEHIPGSLGIDLGEVAGRCFEQALVVRADLTVGRVHEVRIGLLQYIEDVLQGNVQGFPTTPRTPNALADGLKLRKDDETTIGIRMDGLASALRLARNAILLGEKLDVTPVKLREVRHEGVATFDDRPGNPAPVAPVRPTAAHDGVRTNVAGVVTRKHHIERIRSGHNGLTSYCRR